MSRKKSLWPLLWAGLALVLWGAGLFLAQRTAELMEPVSVRWSGENAGASPSQLLRARRNTLEDGGDWPAAVLWRELSGQSVSGQGGSAFAADVLEGFGDLDLLWPGSFLQGYYPAAEDAVGCAVDEALAFRLWGSADVVGRTVRWDGRDYTVRGVLKGTAGLLLVQTAQDSETPLNRLLLRLPGGGADEAAAFLSRCGLPGATVLDQPALSWCLSALAALPGLVLAAGLLCRLWSRGWLLRQTRLLLLLYALPALAAVAAVLWAAQVGWTVPDRLIPTRWSDFDFWARLWGGLAEGVRQALSAGLGRRDGAMWSAALGCVLCAIPAATVMLPAVGRVAVHSPSALLWESLAAMVLAAAMAVALAPLGGLAVPRAMWLLPTAWLAADLCLRRHEATLRPRQYKREEESTL